ncbi:Uncharacterised protein [Bordetella pertussis]|nr:Uncharacterised protein [Bordetella pertussis]
MQGHGLDRAAAGDAVETQKNLHAMLVLLIGAEAHFLELPDDGQRVAPDHQRAGVVPDEGKHARGGQLSVGRQAQQAADGGAGAACLQQGRLILQAGGQHYVVGIEKGNEFAFCPLQGHIASRIYAVVFRPGDIYTRILSGGGAQMLKCVIGRAVIYRNDFNIRIGLRLYGLQRIVDIRRGVAGADYDAYQRGAGGDGPGGNRRQANEIGGPQRRVAGQHVNARICQ